MRTTTITLALAMVLCTFPAFGQEETTLLSGFESLDSLSITMSGRSPDERLELNVDPQFVSEGSASLLLASVSSQDATGNTYLGVSVRFAEPIDATRRTLTFDAWTTEGENTRALYVRGYDTENKCALSWNNWSSPVRGPQKVTVELVPGASMGGFAWENAVAESPNRDEISRIEFIIGTHGKGVPFSIYLDGLRMSESQYELFTDVEKAKPLYPNTPLVEDGAAAAVILFPQGDGWRGPAFELQDKLRDKLGVELPLKDATELTDEEMRATQVVALGAVSNNPGLLHLYAHGYTYADDLYPGPDGYVVQSIHDPWGTGKNVLLAGASTVEGARRGIEVLLESIPADGVAGPVFRVQLEGQAAQRFSGALSTEPDEAYIDSQRRRAEDALEKGAHTGLFGQMASVGSAYAQSHKDGYATVFAWLARRAKEHYDSKPGTYGGPWGMDSDFQIHAVLPTWDQIEESPALSDEDRLEVTKILFQWVSEVGPSAAQSVMGNERVRFNHQTFPALGLLFAGEYFHKYYGAMEANRWLDIADAAFQMQSKAFKSHEDCNGYQWLTQYHTMRYALAKPDLTFFDNGNVRKCADFAILCMDNLGYSVTYGDTGAFVGWWSEMPFLHGALLQYRDPRYAWTLAKKTAVSGRAALGQFNVTLDGEEPADLVGAIAWPLDPYYYKSFGGPERVPQEHAVDKVVFRNGFDPQDQYMLLDGLSNGGHKHLDGNSISRWSENGRIWLADADYILSAPKYHNGVLILRDGQSQQIPDFVELEHIVDLPNFGASATTYRDYAGVDWHRNILWVKDGYFVVADKMVAKEDGDYSFRVVWNTVGEVQLDGSALSVHQNGEYAAIAVTPDCKITLDDDPDYGKNWGAYEHIDEPVVRVMRAIHSVSLKAGEQVTLFSLLHASGQEPSTARLVRIDDNTAAVTGLEEPALVATGDATGAIKLLPWIDMEADAGLLTPTHLFSVGAKFVRSGDNEMEFPVGIDAQADFGSGIALMVEPSTTSAVRPPEPVERRVGPGVDYTVLSLIEEAIANAPPAQAAGGEGLTVPKPLQKLWDYRDTLDAYVITGNRGVFEAVDCGAELSGSPEPLPANVFSQIVGKNNVPNIFDGQLLSTEGGVMWDADRPVTLDLKFDREYDISRIVLKAWFATSSSKGKLFQLGSLQADASGDAFAQDTRRIIDFGDTEMHGNWGEPGHAPHIYEFADLDAKASALRLKLTPRPGTAIYISELEVWGNREGLAAEYAARRDKSAPTHTFNALRMADLEGDGTAEIIAGSSNGSVYVFSADGKKRWEKPVHGAVNAIAIVDFEGDGKPAIVAGCTGAFAVALDAQGEELWKFAVPYYKRAGHVRVALAADLQGEGKQTAVIGADNWHFYAIDAAGTELWRYESVHGSTCGAVGDIDGDGKQEVLCGTEYYWWHVVRPDGKRLFGYHVGSPHANTAATADFTQEGKRVAVFGGADGNVHVAGPDGKKMWQYNTGDEVVGIIPVDIDGDGLDELIAGSMSFNVYAIDAEGNSIWRRDLGSEVSAMALTHAGDAARVVVGCEDGNVYVLDAASGEVVSGMQCAGAVLHIEAGQAADGAVAMVSSEDGDLQALALD